MLEANRRDQRQSAYETFDELLDYCALSAAPVGQLVLRVLGAATPERLRLSDQICCGLQLAEHWQDVREDFERGRVYLPLEDMRRFGCSPAELSEHSAGDRLRALIAFEVARAHDLLDRGAPL